MGVRSVHDYVLMIVDLILNACDYDPKDVAQHSHEEDQTLLFRYSGRWLRWGRRFYTSVSAKERGELSKLLGWRPHRSRPRWEIASLGRNQPEHPIDLLPRPGNDSLFHIYRGSIL